MHRFSELDIETRISDISLVEAWQIRMKQNLINTAAAITSPHRNSVTVPVSLSARWLLVLIAGECSCSKLNLLLVR